MRRFRTQAGRSQAELASCAGISRQAYSAIELGTSIPATDVALRLSQALGASVEELFSPSHDSLPGKAALIAPLAESAALTPHANIHQGGSRWTAQPLSGVPNSPAVIRSLRVPNVLVHTSAEEWNSDLEALMAPTKPSLVAVGCDPSISIVAAHMHGRGVDLSWHEMGSAAALRELAAGKAHVAGCHLLDPESGEFNLPAVASYLPFPATVVTFAVWEQGLVIAPGNPKGIRGIEDLARPGIAIVNREPGSGSRVLLDEALKRAGVSVALIAGYDRAAVSHLSVAEAVGMGLVDTGVAVKAAAIALGLDFVPLSQERYDLVFPDHFLNDEAVAQLLMSLRSASLHRQVESLGGYDVSRMGMEPVTA